MIKLTPLEEEVLKKMLAGKSEWRAILREQARVMHVSSRELTGVGFFTDFSVPPDAPRLPNSKSFAFGNVAGEIDGLKHGADFVLFVRNGAMECLEGCSYGEPWPDDIRTFRLSYWPSGEEEEIARLLEQR
jgi:hypothetical protein